MSRYYYGYLHGFASTPDSWKGVHLKGFLENNFDIPLHLFDLNIAEDKPYFLVSDAISKLLHKDFEILETTNQVQFTWRLIGSSLAPAFNLVEIWNSGTNDNLLSHWKEKGYQEFLGPKSRPFSVPFEFVEDLQKHPPFISVACEGTVIHGSEDQVIPLTSAQAFVESYAPHWKLRIVKDDHALMKQDTIRIIEKETVACFDLKEMEIT
ncbi:hypothetical protein Gasu2_24780 [Galdieria sulphuraria]|nr:hypothetical protein Gasu2_24780 [Galdieria sulphuraria]